MSEPDDRAEPPSEVPEKGDHGFRGAVMGVAATALVLAMLALLGFGAEAGLGVAVGGVLATVNLILFARLVAAFLAQKGSSAPWALLGALKLLGLFAVAWLILRSGVVPALALAAGYASLPIGITLGTLFKKPPPDPTPPPAAKM